mgnify:CR=1 FL=1
MKNLKALKIACISIFAALTLSACSITMPVCATSNPVGSKVGEASGSMIIGLFFDQDASIRKAAINGNITKISTVDIKTFMVAPFFVQYTTIVTGE